MDADPTVDEQNAALRAAEDRWTRATAAYVAVNTNRIRIGEELRAQGRDYLDGIPAFDAATHAVDVAERAAERAFAEWRELEDAHADRVRRTRYVRDVAEQQGMHAEYEEARAAGATLGRKFFRLLGRGSQ